MQIEIKLDENCKEPKIIVGLNGKEYSQQFYTSVC